VRTRTCDQTGVAEIQGSRASTWRPRIKHYALNDQETNG